MKLFGISNHGLALIAALVAVLWGVIFMERTVNLRTQQDYEELIRAYPATPVVRQPEQPSAPRTAVPVPALDAEAG